MALVEFEWDEGNETKSYTKHGVSKEETESAFQDPHRLDFRDPSIVIDKVKGEPVYLILAMTPDKLIRMKPQNLLTSLPIRHLEAVS